MTIISPITIVIPRKTKKDRSVQLNLNIYRNLHYAVSNKIKEIYTEQMRGQLEGLKLKHPIELTFLLYKASNRKTDRANILSIVEKFFCDSLVYYDCIPDDNDDIITATHYLSGGVDKDNPRVCISIKNSI